MSEQLDSRMHQPLATIVWLDPGTTTGLCVLGVDPRWLAGFGSPTWEGLGRAVKRNWFAQVGTDARYWADGHAHRVEPGARVVEAPAAKRGVRPVLSTLSHAPGLRVEHELIDQCVDLLLSYPRAAWGYESFQLRQVAADLSPVRVYSAVVHAELRYGPGRIPYQQSASTAKTTATDDRLKLASLYRPGLPHANDAARHASTFLRRARSDAWLRAEGWPELFRQ